MWWDEGRGEEEDGSRAHKVRGNAEQLLRLARAGPCCCFKQSYSQLQGVLWHLKLLNANRVYMLVPRNHQNRP